MAAEPAWVQDYWAKMASDQFIHPTFQNAEFVFEIEGKQPKVCCLYVIHDNVEKCFIISQEKLDNSSYAGTSHMKAIQSYLSKIGRINSLVKFNYIIGFYYDVGEQKVRSCVNYFFGRSCSLVDTIKEEFEEEIFPNIENHFKKTITQYQGNTSKGLQCKNLIRIGLHCHHHLPKKE